MALSVPISVVSTCSNVPEGRFELLDHLIGSFSVLMRRPCHWEDIGGNAAWRPV